MPTHRKARLFAAFGLSAVLLVSAFATTAFAQSGKTSAAQSVATSAQRAKSVLISNDHMVNASQIPQETSSQAKTSGRALPFLYPKGNAAHQAALHSKGTAAPHNAGVATISKSANSVELPSTFNKFNGQSDSAATCPYFGGCQPPDMGVAASPGGLVLQAVNTSMAVYNLAGTVQAGWPKNTVQFFGIPTPTPANCDPGANNQPFTSDPRAFYDPFDNRFGVAYLQVEGDFGVGGTCTFLTKYWIATSTTPNPNGSWRIFAINMAFGSDPTAGADFTQLGFNADGIYVSANMFGTGFYSEIVGCGKAQIYGGVAFTCNGYFDLTVTGPGGVDFVDTVQPSLNPMSSDNSPTAEFFVNSFNFGDPFGNDCITTACHGAAVWAFSDPGSASNVLSGAFVDTNTYVEPPASDEPTQVTPGGTIGCTGGAGCIDAGDNRVSATTVYHAGALWAAHVTGITNASSQFVPGIQWWQFAPTLAPGYPTHITGVARVQDAYLNASNNFTSLSYPVIMPDLDNDIIMGYDYMGDTIFPSINFTDRRVTDPTNQMTGGLGIIAISGANSFGGSRWGDYEAMSYPATYQDTIWFSSQFANSSNDWATSIMRLHLQLNG